MVCNLFYEYSCQSHGSEFDKENVFLCIPHGPMNIIRTNFLYGISQVYGRVTVVYHSHNNINHSSNTIYIQIQADSVVSDSNGFINFWLRSMASRGEA